MGIRRNTVKTDPQSFIPLGVVNTHAATALEDQFVNVKNNVEAGYTRFHELPEFQKIKGHENPIIIVGGGTTLKNPEVFNKLKELSQKWPVMAAGSPHDWLIQNGIHPQYTAACDPDPVTALYNKEKNLNPRARYLFASCSAPELMKMVPKDRIAMWHCHSDAIQKKIEETKIEKVYQAVGGGCTVGLRCISLAIMLGYTNIQIFGMDSFVRSIDEHHAFDFQDEEKEFLGQTYKIQVGTKDGPNGKTYLCAGYQLAQAAHFKEFICHNWNVFTPTFHGESLLADIYELEKANIEGRAAA